MQTTSDLISIVMPVFNCTEYVRIMIDCILANTYQQWELWAVDDGSETDTLELLKSYSERDERIHFIQRNRSPKGAQTCRNMGMELAQGEYIIFFDSDDYLTPTCLQTRIDAIRQHPELDFMVFPSGVVNNNIFSTDANQYAYGYPVFKDTLGAFARRTLPFVVWNNIYRLDSLRKIGVSWDTSLRSLQDADFNVTTIVEGLSYEYFRGEPMFGYRIDANVGSVSKKAVSVEHQASTLYAIEKFYKTYQQHFGHKYDAALYHGVLTLYNWIMTDGMNWDYAQRMAQTVSRYSPCYGLWFRMQIAVSRVLGTFLPKKRARQIPMLSFLVRHQGLIKKKLKDIRNCQQQ